MPRVYTRKKTKQYSAGDVERAYAAWRDGASVRKAAEMYKVPPMTLHDAIKRSRPSAEFVEPKLEKKVFSTEIENDLTKYLKTSAVMFYGLTPTQIRQLVYKYAIANEIKHPISWDENGMAGKDWFTGFMSRNDTLSIRKPESTSLARISAFNRHTVNGFFDNLEQVNNRKCFESNRVFNLDETGISSTPKMPKIVGAKGSHQFGQVVSREKGELVTVVGIVCASGTALPPAFVFPRMRYDERMMMSGATRESLGLVHKSGWMTSENFQKVMEHFVKYSGTSIENPSLLIMDNHESHLSYEAVEYAKVNGVVILTIPPHTSNKLQPLDVSVFGPFKAYFRKQVQNWMVSNPGKILSIYDLPKLACDAWDAATTPSNIKSGFLKCGIYPLNRDVFREVDFLGSSVTDRPCPENAANGLNTVQSSRVENVPSELQEEEAEYIPDPKEEETDVCEDYTSDSSIEELPRKRRKASGTPRRRYLPSSAPTADTALLAAVNTTFAAPLDVPPTAPDVTSSTTTAAPLHVTPPSAPTITSPTAAAEPCQGPSTRAAATSQPIVTFCTATVNSKSHYVWNTRPQHPATASTPAMNIVSSFSPGPTQVAAQASTEEECFNLFLTDDIINEIVMATNQKIDVVAQRYQRQNSTVKRTSAVEIRAMIGILIFSGYKHDNHLQTKEMWCSISGAPFYKAAMSEVRFAFLLQCLRFDDFTTQNERQVIDKLAPIRRVWDKFIDNCKLHYRAHENLTVDEQLVGFRGRCPFRMYIPDKPAKYGIKLLMMNDSETKYMLNAIPYLGKDASVPKGGLQLGHMYTKQLTQPYHHTNRNVTTNNCFTSVPLVTDLLKNCGLTLVGTVRANKREIPDAMKKKRNRAPGSTAFLFTKDMTLVSYLPNKVTNKKVVLLLSSKHRQPTVFENGKPEIITFYNKTKGGTENFDQMCDLYSCSRKTNRWPMCLFFAIINAAIVNSYIIYRENKMKGQPGKKVNRRQYMRELALQLIKPNSEERMNAPTLQRHFKLIISQVCSLNPPTGAAGGPSAAEMKEPLVRCKLCQSKADKKTRFRCHTCHQPVCPLHYFPICSNCV